MKNFSTIITIIFALTFLSFHSSYSEDKCSSLPKDQQFQAAGFTLGSCKTTVNKQIIEYTQANKNTDMYNNIEHLFVWESMYKVVEDKANSLMPDRGSALVTIYSEAKPPHSKLLSKPPMYMLYFLDNILFRIDLQFIYKENISQKDFGEIFDIYKNYLLENYTDDDKNSSVKNNQSEVLEISVSNVNIILEVDNTFPNTVRLNYELPIYVNKVNELLEEKENKENIKEEQERKEQEKIEGL